MAPSVHTRCPTSSWRQLEKRSSFWIAWWCPSEPPRMRIDSRVESTSFMYTWLATAWPASWMATARVSSSVEVTPAGAALLCEGVHAAGRARLDRRHRLDDVLAVEVLARLGVDVSQGHRADLL